MRASVRAIIWTQNMRYTVLALSIRAAFGDSTPVQTVTRAVYFEA